MKIARESLEINHENIWQPARSKKTKTFNGLTYSMLTLSELYRILKLSWDLWAFMRNTEIVLKYWINYYLPPTVQNQNVQKNAE